MLNRFLILLLLVSSVGCSSPAKKAPNSKSGLDASYSELAIKFDVLTCVFWDGYCPDEGASRAYWKEHFGFAEPEEELAQSYSQLRARYYRAPKAEKDPLKNKNGFFAANALNVDVISDAFLSSSDLSGALGKLRETVPASDREALKNLFTKFEPPLNKLVAQSQFLKSLSAPLGSSFEEKPITELTSFIQFFYRSENVPPLHVLFSWWPPTGHDIGSPEGRYLVLRKNPDKHASGPDDDFALHEFTHVVSAEQPMEQKVLFTKEFLSLCPKASKLEKGEILEEPLAVALGQMLYLDIFFPTRFARTKKWYATKWINHFAQTIYPVVKSYYLQHRQIDSEFIQATARLCEQQKIN